ncbi:MAG: hypothetical protein L6Q71_01935 [Planctomycetes bacterium]|nr:hypothetical protein [Planctomycetota bacterium]NUQ33834.1 hypothetical protein [Planctomycetaceae bacterium]
MRTIAWLMGAAALFASGVMAASLNIAIERDSLHAMETQVRMMPFRINGGTAPYAFEDENEGADTLHTYGPWPSWVWVEPTPDPDQFVLVADIPDGAAIETNVNFNADRNRGTHFVKLGITDAAGNAGDAHVNFYIYETVRLETSRIPTATEGYAYNTNVIPLLEAGSAGVAPRQPRAPFTFEAITALPDGMTMSPDGAVFGTPTTGTASGSPYMIDVEITEYYDQSSNHRFSVVESFEFVVLAADFNLLTTTLPEGEEGVEYPPTQLDMEVNEFEYFTFQATGGLPPGMSLSEDGVLSGIPYCGGAEGSNWRIDVNINAYASELSDPVTVPYAFELAIAGPLLTIDMAMLPTATVGVFYRESLLADGFSGEVNWRSSPLPSGLSVARHHAVGWVIEGTPYPGAEGGYAIALTLEESDSYGSHSVTTSVAFNVERPYTPGTLNILTTYLPPAREHEKYTPVKLEASGGSGAPCNFAAEGLPTGLEVINGGSGGSWIIGTAWIKAGGQYTVVITATDTVSGEQTSSALSLLVLERESSAPETPASVKPFDTAPLVGAAAGGCALNGSDSLAAWVMLILVLALASRRRRTVQ